MLALSTGRLYHPGNIPGTHFCYRLRRTKTQSAAGRIMLKKNSNDTIGNRTHDLPACSAVPQPTAPLRAPVSYENASKKIPVKIHFIHLVNNEIYCIFKTSCTISVFHKLQFLSFTLRTMLTFLRNHALNFKYPPRPRKN